MTVPANLAPELSVVIPVYKNADSLEILYSRLCSVLEQERISFEIIFVDDACPQHSLEILKQLAKNDPRLVVLSMAQNVGQQIAVLAGMSVAEGLNIAIMDADLQDPPEALPFLIKKLAEGYEVVFAGRRGKYEASHRLLTSNLYKSLLHLLTGIPIDAGLFLMAKKVLGSRLLQMPVTQPHIPAMIAVSKARTVSIPTERSLRHSGVSAYSSWMRMYMGFHGLSWVIGWKLGFRPKKKIYNSISTFPISEKLGSKFHDNDKV
jgi:glycosyltransferase involved in cell wall biosynthesis